MGVDSQSLLIAGPEREGNSSAPGVTLRGFTFLGFISFVCVGCGSESNFARPAILWNPATYVSYRTDSAITVDGVGDEPQWALAPWTSEFVDITGDPTLEPRFRTRVKMLWDDRYWYFLAELQEPHVWGTIRQRDSVIYQDNDFEIFIDPDGDSHEYYELEINALGTEWDLMLIKPYRDGGPALNAWDIQGLQTAVSVDGTLNNPQDRDTGWNIEVAIPWAVMKEAAHVPTPPNNGDQWRLNFSRVEWQTDLVDSAYVRKRGPDGLPAAEDNWVWSPQGLVAMHYPEMWGVVQFSTQVVGQGQDEFVVQPTDAAKQVLYEVYYEQRTWFDQHGYYARSMAALGLADRVAIEGFNWPPLIETTANHFEASLQDEFGTVVSVTNDGHANIRRVAGGE